jgi:hypothetical protein
VIQPRLRSLLVVLMGDGDPATADLAAHALTGKLTHLGVCQEQVAALVRDRDLCTEGMILISPH